MKTQRLQFRWERLHLGGLCLVFFNPTLNSTCFTSLLSFICRLEHKQLVPGNCEGLGQLIKLKRRHWRTLLSVQKSEQHHFIHNSQCLLATLHTHLPKAPLAPPGTTILYLEFRCSPEFECRNLSTLIRRDLNHEHFDTKLQNCLFWGSISAAAPQCCVHHGGETVQSLWQICLQNIFNVSDPRSKWFLPVDI